MLFLLALLLFISPTVAALTDLQANCTGPGRRYNGTSCYVLVKNGRRQSVAKTSCNHYLGYSGHLFHIRNAAAQATAKELISNYSSADDNVYTGLEPINSSAALTDQNNWGHYYRDGTFVSATNLPWAPGQPLANRVNYQPSSDKIFTLDEATPYFFMCEYEEALKQPVTDLEQKCVNLASSFKTLFTNDICYVMHPENKTYTSAKVACNDLSGYNGHLAHIRTISELWIVEALRLAAGVTYARLAIEQTDLSSTNASIGWYLTTPTNQSMPATFLPWAASNPTAGLRSIAVTTGYPNSFATVDSNTAYPFLCQYDYTTTTTSTTTTTTTTTTTGAVAALTDLQANCTGPDRLYNGTSCYVIVNSAKSNNWAKLWCNHYLGYSGHMFHLRNAAVQAAVRQKITSYIGSGTSVWTGLELINASAATNDNNRFGYYYRNGTFVSPTYLPWSPGQPSANSTNDRVIYDSTADKISSSAESSPFSFVCEYEEALRQPVTDLEQKCVNLTNYPNKLFVNDVCYVVHSTFKNYNDAKVSCNALSDYNGHLAHIRTMSELWIAEILRPQGLSASLRVGIEQTNLSSTDPYNGWYFTTPTDQPVLTTFLPWAPSHPVTGQRTIATTAGYPGSFKTLSSNFLESSLCLYDKTTAATTTTTTSTTTAMTTTGTATALTDLQANCTGPDRQYSGTSCYVIVGSSPQKYHPEAKTLCNHYLGYSGHLVHIKNAAVKGVLKQLMTTYNSTAVNIAWTGLELLNSSTATNDSNNWGYYYRNGTYFSQTYIPWAATEPRAESNRSRGYYISSTDRMHTTSLDQLAYIACEYAYVDEINEQNEEEISEEALKQPVTDLEEKCANLASSFKTLFTNDICYVMHPENKTYINAKVACNDLSGYNGHLAHIRTVEELWIAEAFRVAAGASYVRLGIERVDLSSTNLSIGWYLTRPTNQSMPTNFLPWAASHPLANYPVIVLASGYPKSFATVYSKYEYPFLCQYDYTTTTTSTTTTTTTSTTTPTTGTCAPAPAPTTTGSATSWFYRYTFGHFTNPSYFLSESTASQSMCLIMCQRNELCFGYTYNSGTSNCQLLAIIANELGCSSQLTVDSQFETFIHERH